MGCKKEKYRFFNSGAEIIRENLQECRRSRKIRILTVCNSRRLGMKPV